MIQWVGTISAERTAQAFIARLAARPLDVGTEFERLHQACLGALLRVGRTPPTRARRLFDASVDPTEARNV
jgi:hypothetical protein